MTEGVLMWQKVLHIIPHPRKIVHLQVTSSHECVSHVTRMCESCHTNVWVMSHECVSHVTHFHMICLITHVIYHPRKILNLRVTLSHECVSDSRCHTNVWASHVVMRMCELCHAFWYDLPIMSVSHDLLRLISHVTYGVAMISWLLQSIFLFCRVSSLLQGCFVETCVSREPSNRSHLISSEKDPTSTNHVVTRMCKPHHRLSYNLFRLIIHATYHPRKFLHPPWRSASHEPARHVVTSVSHATHSHRLCASSLIQSVSSHNTCHVSSKTDPYNCRRILQMTHLRHTSSRKRVSHATHSILHNLLCLILLVVVFQEDILTAYTVTQCNWMKYA